MTNKELVEIILLEVSFKEKGNKIKEICSGKSNDNFSGFLIQIEMDVDSNFSANEVIEKSIVDDAKEKQIMPESNFCPTCGRKIIEDKQEETIRVHDKLH